MALTITYDHTSRTFQSVALDGRTFKNVARVGLSADGVAVIDTEGNTLFAAEAGGVADNVPSVAATAKAIAEHFSAPDEPKRPTVVNDPLFTARPKAVRKS